MWCWSGWRGILRKLSLCYSIVYYYKGSSSSYRLVDCIRLWSWCSSLTSERLCVFRLHGAMGLYINFLLTSFSLPFSELSLVDWPLMWLTNHRPSVLWHCWLGHLTCKIVSEMTYNVLSGTLNSTVGLPRIITDTVTKLYRPI